MKILVDKLPERPEQCIFSTLSQGTGWSNWRCEFKGGSYCVLKHPPSFRRKCPYIKAVKTNLETEEISCGEDYD